MRAGLLPSAYDNSYTGAMREGVFGKHKGTSDWLNRDALRKRMLEVVGQEDGAPQLQSGQIWSDEDIPKNSPELDYKVLTEVGDNLLEDKSAEAKALLRFLSTVFKTNTGKELKTAKDVGASCLACWESERRDPNSDISQMFKALSESWIATRSNDEQHLLEEPQVKTANEIDDIVWSENPGCFERHLQRKYCNPLFSPFTRNFTQHEVDVARQRDERDTAELQRELKKLVSSAMTLPEEIDSAACNKARRSIDRLLCRAAEIGGAAAHEITSTLLELRESLVNSWQKALTNQEEAQKALDDEEGLLNTFQMRFCENKFVVQLCRADTPITGEDLIPALLSESPDTIRLAMSLAGEGVASKIRHKCKAFVEELKASGEDVSEISEKLRATVTF